MTATESRCCGGRRGGCCGLMLALAFGGCWIGFDSIRFDSVVWSFRMGKNMAAVDWSGVDVDSLPKYVFCLFLQNQ